MGQQHRYEYRHTGEICRELHWGNDIRMLPYSDPNASKGIMSAYIDNVMASPGNMDILTARVKALLSATGRLIIQRRQ